jgi:hypothetical protein
MEPTDLSFDIFCRKVWRGARKTTIEANGARWPHPWTHSGRVLVREDMEGAAMARPL